MKLIKFQYGPICGGHILRDSYSEKLQYFSSLILNRLDARKDLQIFY